MPVNRGAGSRRLYFFDPPVLRQKKRLRRGFRNRDFFKAVDYMMNMLSGSFLSGILFPLYDMISYNDMFLVSVDGACQTLM